jgi:hypothetical protein
MPDYSYEQAYAGWQAELREAARRPSQRRTTECDASFANRQRGRHPLMAWGSPKPKAAASSTCSTRT